MGLALAFPPKLEILPEAQRRLWTELSATPSHFVLYGGTAIALRLGHRHSEDFDFFSNQSFVPQELLARVSYLKGSVVRQESPNTLTCSVERGGRVLVSFFGGLALNRAAEPETAEGAGLQVASLLDLAATKLNTILGRASLKDYLDIDALLRAGIALTEALGAARVVFGPQFSPMASLKALTYFEEGDLAQLGQDVRHRLETAVRIVELSGLPQLEGRHGIQ